MKLYIEYDGKALGPYFDINMAEHAFVGLAGKPETEKATCWAANDNSSMIVPIMRYEKEAA